MHPTDPITIAQKLITCPSVTPLEGGAIAYLETLLEPMGFTCHRLSIEGTENIFAQRGTGPGSFCFAGHTDVVPAGDMGAWTHDPFQGHMENGFLYGRGAVDMKGGIAAFIAALGRLLNESSDLNTSFSLLITGDEEGPALHGTQRVLPWLADNNLVPAFCLVGEPTCREKLGDTIKIGRRGTLTGYLEVIGKQGHVAYPHRADNPIPRLLNVLQALNKGPQESPSEFFDPSHLEITTIDIGNSTSNIIPARAKAVFNIRYSDQQTPASLTGWIQGICKTLGGDHHLDLEYGGDSFVQTPNLWMHEIAQIVQTHTGITPNLNTIGGTSDARFIYKYCPVLEFGPMGRTMHQVNECIALADLENLTKIYLDICRRWVASR